MEHYDYGKSYRDAYENKSQFCPATWDGYSCWPDSPAGKINEGVCPDHMMYAGQAGDCPTKSFKQCFPNGTWFTLNTKKGTREWTDYSACNGMDMYIKRFSFGVIWYSVSAIIIFPSLFVLKRMPDRRGSKRIKIISTTLFWLLLNSILSLNEKAGMLMGIYLERPSNTLPAKQSGQIIAANSSYLNDFLYPIDQLLANNKDISKRHIRSPRLIESASADVVVYLDHFRQDNNGSRLSSSNVHLKRNHPFYTTNLNDIKDRNDYYISENDKQVNSSAITRQQHQQTSFDSKRTMKWPSSSDKLELLLVDDAKFSQISTTTTTTLNPRESMRILGSIEQKLDGSKSLYDGDNDEYNSRRENTKSSSFNHQDNIELFGKQEDKKIEKQTSRKSKPELEQASRKHSKPSTSKHLEGVIWLKLNEPSTTTTEFEPMMILGRPLTRCKRRYIDEQQQQQDRSNIQDNQSSSSSMVNNHKQSVPLARNPVVVIVCWILSVAHLIVRQLCHGWMFTGAIYLCCLLIFAPAEPPSQMMKWLIIVTNCLPIILAAIYILARTIYDRGPLNLILVPYYKLSGNQTQIDYLWANSLDCWLSQSNSYSIDEIMYTPNLILVVLNITLFVITLIIMCRITVQPGSSRPVMSLANYCKAVGTLVILYGAHYVLMIYQAEEEDCEASQLRQYALIVVHSTQGSIIAYVFCYRTQEGREILKRWCYDMMSMLPEWMPCHQDMPIRQRGSSRSSSYRLRANGMNGRPSGQSASFCGREEVTIELNDDHK